MTTEIVNAKPNATIGANNRIYDWPLTDIAINSLSCAILCKLIVTANAPANGIANCNIGIIARVKYLKVSQPEIRLPLDNGLIAAPKAITMTRINPKRRMYFAMRLRRPVYRLRSRSMTAQCTGGVRRILRFTMSRRQNAPGVVCWRCLRVR